MTKVWCELNEKQTRICVFFSFDRDLVEKAKRIPGRRFIGPDDVKPGEPSHYWTFPLEVRTARLLRDAFPQMKLGKAMKAWGHRAVAQEGKLGTLALADTAELVNLPKHAPDIYEAIKSRPYQKADVAFMAASNNPLNANAPGLGKTLETIASVFESETHMGPQLILAPVTSLEVVWAAELLHEEHGQDLPVLVASGDRGSREWALSQALDLDSAGEAFWLICNPQMAQVKLDKAASEKKGTEIYRPVYQALFEIEWNNIIVDEFHKCGMGNPNTITRKGLTRLQGKRRVALSGTPMGGRTSKLWGVLNWLEPDKFGSKWRWFDHYLVVENREIWTSAGSKKVATIGDIKPNMSEQFYKEHAPYMIRRTVEEVRPELPAKHRIDVWCTMGKEQKKQYDTFAAKAELKIEEESMNAIGILAEYTRLRQFAIAKQEFKREVRKGDDFIVPYPLPISCKLDQVYRILDEHGVTKDKGEDENSEKSQEQVIIFSQFSKVCEMVAEELNKLGITASTLTGATTGPQRKKLVDDFEARAGAQVLVMNTGAGGVAITLNQSDAIIFMDETWVPDDQDQAEDRNRNRNATIYYLRTLETIEEYVLATNVDKRNVNDVVLDVHRKRIKAMANA
jgi:Zierdtviridae DNA helicase